MSRRRGFGRISYTFDYSGDGKTPAISYGNVNVTSPSGWFLSQIRERAEYDFNSYRTAQADGEWDPLDWLKIQAGFDWKNYGYATADLRRTNGSTANLDSFIPTAIENAPLSTITQLVTLHGVAAPAGTPTT